MAHIPNPTILEREGQTERAWDVYSRLFKERVIYLGTPINDDVANLFVAQLLYLSGDDPDKDIQIYINSPGGDVTAGLVMYDVMQHVKPDVSTVCLNASSMGSVLLSAGTKGKRFIVPNGEVMIHQGSGGFQGNTPDLEIYMRRQLELIDRLIRVLAYHTGQPYEKVKHDSNRDFFMSAHEAVEYGIVDEILPANRGFVEHPAFSPNGRVHH
ncbi:MAG: ATP-dependent Clp protease proteolytic subunit [Dehalococcoidia bacterium]